MKKHKGYIDINFGAVFAVLIAIGAILGVLGYLLVSYTWPYVKAWLHVATA